MEPRINMLKKGGQALNALFGLSKYTAGSKIEKHLSDLICFRVSQVNGCAYCLDMHAKDLRASGETEQRLYVLDAWREAPFYSDRERAALAWAEALTKLTDTLVPKEIFEEARAQFSETELIDLTMVVITINSYNHMNIAFGADVGSYKVGQWEGQAVHNN